MIRQREFSLNYYYMDWVFNHPRFGILMVGLIALSFSHNHMVAVVLFVLFAIEIGLRILLLRHKSLINPYKDSQERRFDILFLVFDIIGVLSLLVTILVSDAAIAENSIALRAVRGLYLLRSLRFIRYLDLQSFIHSPSYGMFLSVLILLSFFVSGTILWLMFMFFTVEVIVRFFLLRGLQMQSPREKKIEWGFWLLDVFATIAMIPGLPLNELGSILRSFRLIRLFRPWAVILRNLREVVREGQYWQEINLIILLLIVMSIIGAAYGHYFFGSFDYTGDNVVDEHDRSLFAQIWFSFRTFTDAGNSITYPENSAEAIYSALAVILGVFVFSFFIGIGSSIVSGLMSKLRNERLNINSHLVMIGWNSVAPFILTKLEQISLRTFAKIKLVLLNDATTPPEDALGHPWVMYRSGKANHSRDLQRVNIGLAKQAILNMPDQASQSEQLAFGQASLINVRKHNPEIYLNYVVGGTTQPFIPEYQHMLQIGWDRKGFYNKPTVLHSRSEFRASLISNVMHYSDFDQVITRLMIPDRDGESSLLAVNWCGQVIDTPNGKALTSDSAPNGVPIRELAIELFAHGITLVGFNPLGENHLVPIYALDALKAPFEVQAVLGIALSENYLFGKLRFTIEALHKSRNSVSDPLSSLPSLVWRHEQRSEDLHILIIGHVGTEALIIKNLLQRHKRLRAVFMDSFGGEAEAKEFEGYIERRLRESGQDLPRRVDLKIIDWDFLNMSRLKNALQNTDYVFVAHSRSRQWGESENEDTIISVLSHLTTCVLQSSCHPTIFSIVEKRQHARLLQEELREHPLPFEIHVAVPNEVFGTYIAHTSYHMFVSADDCSYQAKRALRHAIDDLVADHPDSQDRLELSVIKVGDIQLPDSPKALFASLLDQGYLWIGYRMNQPFVFSSASYRLISRLFPMQHDHACLRQHEIVINPFGSPVSARSWFQKKESIEELIVLHLP